jgi:outer membrane protein OmpA-like peptidoglycan-associated protein
MKKFLLIVLLNFSGISGLLRAQESNFFDFIDFRVNPLTLINTNESQISPQIVNGEIYFSSIREENIENANRQDNSAFYDVYTTQIGKNGEPVSEKELVPGFGNLYHEGPVSYCEKTGELFVTISNVPENTRRLALKKVPVRLSLVIMKQFEGKWALTYEFPFNNDKYNFAHPAISISGDTLIFSSDLAGGFGNSDLYMSIRVNGEWNEPVNLGERINTPGNEMFPAFGPGGMLIYSSNGIDPNFGQLDLYYTRLTAEIKPVNLGEKINSPADDFGLVIHPTGNFGYFSSNRFAWKKDDIFMVEFLPQVYSIRGKVITKSDEEAVQDAMVYLEDCKGNRIRSVISGFFGNFEFSVPKGKCYQVHADKEGFVSEIISVSGDEFIELSLRQVFNYQVLVKDFENENTVVDAEMFCNGSNWKSDSAGIIHIRFDSVFNCPVRVSKPGYFDNTFNLNPERFVPGEEITDTVWLFKKETGKVFSMKTIDFYIDMWRIMPRSESELNQLAKLMEDNPDLRIEISAHTDSRLEDQYNMWLSQKRADSVLEYLVQHGIENNRIVAKGYGESRLLNHCANGVICNEKQHLVNRRIEFVILDY